MSSPNTTETPAPLTHEEKWAEAEEELAANTEDLKRFYWKRAGRPMGPEEDYLPEHLWKSPPKEWWED